MKLMIVANFRGWAWDYKAQNLRKCLAKHDIEADIFYMYDYVCDPITGWHDIGYATGRMIPFASYEAVLLFSIILQPIFNQQLDLQRTFIGVCSHGAHGDADPQRPETVGLINQFAGVFVLNQQLYDDFRPLVPHLYYCPNGVDITVFRRIRPVGTRKKLVVGWVGNPDHENKKGFYEIIQPLQHQSFDVVIANNSDLHRSYEDMVEFYNEIDVYLCASKTEGTPNPCLEAAACGRPLLTTPVGNMPQFVRHGINGFFVERSLDSVCSFLAELDTNRQLLLDMSQQVEKDIRSWDWSKQSENFVAMLQTVR